MKSSHNGRKNGWAVPFFTIWTGQALSLVGSQAGVFALVWWLTQRTGSGTVLATATMVAMLPGVLLGPFIGALVDRWNRRWIMIVADSIIALFSAWLAILFWADALQIWHVYVIGFVRALGGTFHHPAMQASTSLMVPDEQLARVAGMNQTLYGVLTIVTPPLGAFLMSILPLHWIMAIDVITAAFAIAPLFFVHIPQPPRQARRRLPRREAASLAQVGTSAAQRPPSLWQDVREGFLYIWHWPGMFLLLTMATLLNFLIHPAMSLLPLLITKHFQGQALHLGWMNSSWGIGVILGGLTLSAWGGFRKRIATSLVGVIGMGIGFLLVGLAPATALWLALGAMFFAGTMNPIANGPIGALLQSIVAPEVQGRVFMIVGSMSGFAAPLGLAVAGPVADALGTGSWFIVGGAACILMGAIALFVPAIMQIEEQRQAPAGAEAVASPASGHTGEKVY
jgi:DHA3 family macrolide efflux protein-like MFS transporter